jgi:hypothetical protein
VQQHYKRRSDTEEHRRLPRRAPRTTCVRAVAWRTHGAPFARLWHLSGLHMPSLTHAIPPPPPPPAPLPPSSSSCIHTNTASPSLCTHTYLHGPALASTPPSQPELGGNPMALTPCVRAPAWRVPSGYVAFLASWVTWGLTPFRNPREGQRTHSTGLVNQCTRAYIACLPALVTGGRRPAFTSGVVPGLDLVPIDPRRRWRPPSQPRQNQPGHRSLSPNTPIGHVWRSDLAQIRQWTQTQAPSAPRAAIMGFWSS